MSSAAEEEAGARVVKRQLRRASTFLREVRKRWYELRDTTKAGLDIGHEPKVMQIGDLTAELWAAEADLADAAAAWRDALARRQALPVAERWDLAKMERWAAAQPEV